jgi:hypothetical protein
VVSVGIKEGGEIREVLGKNRQKSAFLFKLLAKERRR